MTRPGESMSPKVRKLFNEAREARQLRDALTDPDVVALKGEKVRKIGEIGIALSVAILLVFTIITVHEFVISADGTRAGIDTLEWFGAWFFEPGIIVGLVAILLWEGFIVRQRVRLGPKAWIAKIGLLASTYIMNTWNAWELAIHGTAYAPVFFHSIPPLAVFWLTEAREETLDKIEESIINSHVWSVRRRNERAERLAQMIAEDNAEKARRGGEESDAPTPAPVVAHAPVDVREPERPPPVTPLRPSISSPLASAAATVPIGPPAPPLFQASTVRHERPRDEVSTETNEPVPQTITQPERIPEQRSETDTVRTGVPSMAYQPEPPSEKTSNGHATASGTVATKTKSTAIRGGRPRSPEVERQRRWVHDQLDAGNEVTGAMLDRHFNNTDRNGSRLVASVKRERESKNEDKK